MSKRDVHYKELLREGLKDAFSLECKIEDLDAIAGPDELMALLKKFRPKDFTVGLREKNKFVYEMNPLQAFKNLVEGKYKVNLHQHSTHSDGHASPEEILDFSLRYAKKSAAAPKDGLPPFTFAVTDHDNIQAPKEIAALISQSPKQCKDIKFVTGSEIYFIDKTPDGKEFGFEAAALGFNPFDKALNEQLVPFRSKPAGNPIQYTDTIRNADGIISYAHPFIQRKLTPDFIAYLKEHGIGGIETNYQYLNHMYYDNLIDSIRQANKVAKEYNFFKTGGTDSHDTNPICSAAKEIIDKL